MDDIRLRFYYALMSYSLGLISFVSIQKTLPVLVLDLFIIILTPLTLLISDTKNIYIEISIEILFPLITLLMGIFQGYVIIKLYDYYFINKNKEESIIDDDEPKKKKDTKKINTIAHYCKAGLIAATTMSIFIFYIIDLAIPFLVTWGYPGVYLKLRFFFHLVLSAFLIGLSMGFKQKRFAKLWGMVAYSTSTILMTTLFIFNIITDNGYFVYLVFFIHFTLIIISLPLWIMILYRFMYKIIIKNHIIPRIIRYSKKYENVGDEAELNTFNSRDTIAIENK